MKAIKFIKSNMLTAIAIAAVASIIGLQSFRDSSTVTLDNTKAEPALYWYEVDLVNNELGPQKNSSPLTKSQAMSNPSITSCNDAASTICLRGYETEQNEGDPFTAAPTSDHRINRSNP
ncbi:hypothetical protein [Sphingobacterium sp. LRF_L2]|uniref:hypothetical protein n=1 Tax=Sphingobacterium sp. LRF_L2 TaxID=3369421 RepID=UPI003F646E1B